MEYDQKGLKKLLKTDGFEYGYSYDAVQRVVSVSSKKEGETTTKTLEEWSDLINQALEGNVSQIFISHKDRFVRFGYDWFSNFLISHGAEMIVVNNESLSPQEEMVQDLISIIHVFSCRIYGLRKYKSQIKDVLKNDKSI